MECRAFFEEASVPLQVGDYGCSRDVVVAGTGLEWIAGGCRWDLLGWSQWAEVELVEDVGAGAVGSDAAAREAPLVPAEEEVLYVVVQAVAPVTLSVLLVAEFVSVAGFVVVEVAITTNSACQILSL